RRRRPRRGLLPGDRARQGPRDQGGLHARGVRVAAAGLPLRRAVPPRADLPRRRPRRPGHPAQPAADRGARALRGDRVRAAPGARRAYCDRRAGHGLAGRGCGLGFGHDQVPAALREAAASRGFPLFCVPYELPFIAVTERAFTQLVNEQYAVMRRSIAAHERLQRIVLSEAGLDAVAGALSTLIGGAALVFDGRGEPLAQRTFRREAEPDVVATLAAELHERARNGDGRAFAPHHPEVAGRALALPVADAPEPRRTLPQAWLVAIKD